MTILRFTLCALMLSVAPAVFAQQTRASEPPVQPIDKSAPNYVRCVKVLETGSLVSKTKICRTNAEWRQSNDNGKKNADDIIMHNRGGINING